MPRDFEGRIDPQVATDLLVKVEPEDPLMSALDVYIIVRDDWCAAQKARDVAGSCFLQRFVLPRGPDRRVPSEILEPILDVVKVEEVQATEASPEG